MEQQWRHKRFLGFEFPEQYWLKISENHFIEVKANPFRGNVKIKIKTPDGDCNESTISNGVVIDERDMNTKKSKYLEHFFSFYHKELCSVPDSGVLKIIGNNYGVLSHFLEKPAPKREEKKTDIGVLLKIPQKILRLIAGYLDAILKYPKMSDLFDSCAIALIGLATYYQNFDYVSSGISAAFASLFAGYYDWLVRRKNPYLMKIILASLVGGSLFFAGAFYQ